MSQSFIPLYDSTSLSALLRNWLNKSLDGIHSRGNVAVGVKGCDRGSHGFQAIGLLQRFTSEEVEHVLGFMGSEAEPMPTWAALVVMAVIEERPIQDIARALRYDDCTQCQRQVELAKDEFMRRLLAT
jgi:hypothetical protein